LRFIRLACDIVVDARSLQIELAAKRLLDASRLYQAALQRSYRQTGKISSQEIAENHIDVAGALGLLRIHEGVAEPRAGAVALSAFDERTATMELTLGERVQFLDRLLTIEPCLDEVRGIFSKIREVHEAAPSDFRGVVKNDRVVKSHLDWLVDLRLVGATRGSRGKFHLTSLGEKVQLAMTDRGDRFLPAVMASYVADDLGRLTTARPPDPKVRDAILKGAARVMKRVPSPVDPKLVPGEPVLLIARLILLTEARFYIGFAELLAVVEESAQTWGIYFSWNRGYKSGHFRLP